ncbi:hypothetical protein [Patulibacter minatonensis]|uniref:hypothetical protein n=1 Tax=Patulibacter minatonensis TaxID=298163 RepID=UPI0012F7B104|nr:hypothetical protein [Patulibacter minatonensis]
MPRHDRTGDTELSTHFIAVADWLTEELSQELYAARQDLADAAHDVPECADEVSVVRATLLVIIHRLHEVATTLRENPAAEMPVEDLEDLAERIAEDCRAAEDSMSRGRDLMARPARADVPSRRLGRSRPLVALLGGPPVLRPGAGTPASRGPRRVRRPSC